MSEAPDPNEGLKILARIIAKAYLADNQRNNTMSRTRKRGKKGS
jgi:hypothetical protein